MTRDMSLTLLLMVTSIAAAVAAPGADDPANGAQCAHVVAAAPVLASAVRLEAALPVVLPAANRVDVAPAGRSCAVDVSAPYRQWHHGALKLNLGCAAIADT